MSLCDTLYSVVRKLSQFKHFLISLYFWLDLFLCVLPSDYAGSSRGGLAQNSHYDYGRGNAGQQPQMSTFFSQ